MIFHQYIVWNTSYMVNVLLSRINCVLVLAFVWMHLKNIVVEVVVVVVVVVVGGGGGGGYGGIEDRRRWWQQSCLMCRLTFWPPVSVCRPRAPSWSSPCPAHSAACCWTTRITKQQHQHIRIRFSLNLTQIRSLKTLQSLLVYVKREFVRIRYQTQKHTC